MAARWVPWRSRGVGRLTPPPWWGKTKASPDLTFNLGWGSTQDLKSRRTTCNISGCRPPLIHAFSLSSWVSGLSEETTATCTAWGEHQRGQKSWNVGISDTWATNILQMKKETHVTIAKKCPTWKFLRKNALCETEFHRSEQMRCLKFRPWMDRNPNNIQVTSLRWSLVRGVECRYMIRAKEKHVNCGAC